MSILWAGDDGTVLCTAHAGMYLSTAVQQRPAARSHRTPLGTWDRLTKAEIASDPEVFVCETCARAPR